jgi:hypothetical protein
MNLRVLGGRHNLLVLTYQQARYPLSRGIEGWPEVSRGDPRCRGVTRRTYRPTDRQTDRPTECPMLLHFSLFFSFEGHFVLMTVKFLTGTFSLETLLTFWWNMNVCTKFTLLSSTLVQRLAPVDGSVASVVSPKQVIKCLTTHSSRFPGLLSFTRFYWGNSWK